jgi:hypothetical protein
MTTASDISAELSCIDSCATNRSLSRTFGDIEPGGTATGSRLGTG